MKIIRKALALALALVAIQCFPVAASAANVSDATIDTSKTGSLSIYKYDLTSAEKDGVWDSSYVSTGVKDETSVNAVLGSEKRVTQNTNGTVSYGYAIQGVEFTYLKVADIRTYTETEQGVSHVEVLYGIPANATTNQLLAALGLSVDSRYKPADQTVDGVLTYYYQSDTLINGLSTALARNAATVKNALENYVRSHGGTAMTQTDAYGHTAASGLPLGLYLVVETSVPEMVTSTTAPFLVSLPMTSVDGTNATDGGQRWLYDVTLYPKNLTGIPSLEKTVRESSADTGKNTGSAADITDGYAHTATASDHDIVEYQVISTLPAITSEASYLTCYTFEDTLSQGITYNKNDVVIEFFEDASCTSLITTWRQTDSVQRFSVSYGEDNTMTIAMTAQGLQEINSSKLVYTGTSMVNSGYSDCTMRITYAATVNSDDTVTYGDGGNPNAVTLTWQRSNTAYYDILNDDCHVYTYGIDLTKEFSDGAGDFANVEMRLHNDTDGYYVQAELHEDGIYYVTGHAQDEQSATRFVHTDSGKIIVKGLEDDVYTITETKTDNGYTLLRDNITVVIESDEADVLCDCYDQDTLGVTQNDSRYPQQKHLEHKLLTASATVDSNAVDMEADKDSVHALVPLTVVNTRGFDLPQTGSNGNWMFPVLGLSVMALAGTVILILRKK
jgi:fimbrial isopeptide formation D2 family protein/LPXTG-motif cell wall-anchored protein